MLSGQIKSFDDIPEKDFRGMLPRFQPPNFENNMKLVKQLETLAQKKKCTSAQLALAWVVSLSKKNGMPRIIPILGSTNRRPHHREWGSKRRGAERGGNGGD